MYSSKYRYTTLFCNVIIWIRKSEFVAKTQFLCTISKINEILYFIISIISVACELIVNKLQTQQRSDRRNSGV